MRPRLPGAGGALAKGTGAGGTTGDGSLCVGRRERASRKAAEASSDGGSVLEVPVLPADNYGVPAPSGCGDPSTVLVPGSSLATPAPARPSPPPASPGQFCGGMWMLGGHGSPGRSPGPRRSTNVRAYPVQLLGEQELPCLKQACLLVNGLCEFSDGARWAEGQVLEPQSPNHCQAQDGECGHMR